MSRKGTAKSEAAHDGSMEDLPLSASQATRAMETLQTLDDLPPEVLSPRDKAEPVRQEVSSHTRLTRPF